MALQYISVPDDGFSLGIDARSSENSIPPGFARDLLNADIVEGRVRKRVGYQGYAGNVPIRVTQMDYDSGDTEVCFVLPEGVTLEASGISLETTPSSPIVVQGLSSTFAPGSGPFTTSGDSVKYYPGFTVPIRKELAAPSGTLIFPATEHGIATTDMFVGVVESTSSTNRSYQYIQEDAIRIDESNYNIEVDYTVAQDTNVFIYQKDRTATTGESYITPAPPSPGALEHDGSPISQSFTILASTHNLSNYNIIVQVQQDLGTSRQLIDADSVTINSSGDVTITISNDTGSTQTYYAILSAAPVANKKNDTVNAGSINASSQKTIQISGLTSPWIFYSIYLLDGANNKELVYSDTISYDDTNSTANIAFTNAHNEPRNFEIYYEYGVLKANRLCVQDSSVSTTGSDTRPQITIWGLEHSEIYPVVKSEKEGWVTHIDSYRRSGEQRLVCGLGGNLYSARAYSEAASTHLYAQLYPKLNTRTSGNLFLGPAIWDTGDTPARTRGYITADDSDTHWALVTAVEYDTGTGWTKYTLSLPNMQILDSTGSPTILDNVVSTTADLEDWLTVERMSYTRHNGTFRIMDTTIGTNSIILWVENDSNSADYNDTGVGGQAGIFTDRLNWAASSPYIAGDELVSAVLDDSSTSTVLSSSGTSSISDGWTDIVQIPPGVQFLGRRTSSVVPMRNSYPTASGSTDNLVRGDMLSYTGIDRQVRVKYINPDQDRTVDITVSSGIATVDMSPATTQYLTPGMQILLLEAGVYTGIQTILDVTSDTSFTFETEETDSASNATLVGETVHIDEELEWEDTSGDTNTFQVAERWIPIEAPTDLFNLTPTTYIQHLDYGSYVGQAFLRSTMVVDNMYLTNGLDEVLKFDGSNIYQAGIIPWQPGLFITQDTSASAEIVTDLRSITSTSNATIAADRAAGRLQIAADDVNTIPVDTPVRLAGSTQTYTVRDYVTGTTNYIVFDRALDSAVVTTPDITEIATFRYYFRLNAVDVNNNIIASAVTGYQDHVVELTQNAAVNIKLIGLPQWGIYDYDRLECQIYRTKQSQAAPFYLVTTLPMDFDRTQGYLQFTDAFADDDLTELDVVSSALKGAELGTAWSEPLRAKYITSIGNRLVLGNVKDYPQLDFQIVSPAALSDSVLAGDSLLFRRDRTEDPSLTDTDMTNRVRYQWVNGFSGTPTIEAGVNQFIVNGITQAVVAGDWIYLTHDTVSTTNRDLTLSGWWQISSVTGAGPYAATISYVAIPPTHSFLDAAVTVGTDIITIASHGYYQGQVVRVSNLGGALPTGLVAGTDYYVVSATTNTFKLSLTIDGAAVDITAAAGGGTHTITALPATPNIKYVVATDPTDVPVLLGTDGNLGMVNGDSFNVFDSMRRMGMAINATMRMVDTNISGMGAFVPWLIARSGNDTPPGGRLIVRQPKHEVSAFGCNVYFSGYELFVNSKRRDNEELVESTQRVYPSRLLVSYQNYPEIFDNPTSILDTESDSAIDINSADGQEITGVIPFFGEAAFGAAQQSGILVVFKSNSIYLVDINQKVAGQNAVQRIETEGLGCTAPYSISVTKGGIMFANESGIYCLRRNQAIEYIGRYMERNWTERVDLDRLSIVQGHHYGIGRQYKLSVPIADPDQTYIENSEVYTYNHTGESEADPGAWSRYDSHPATGWANLAPNAFFASTGGRVFSIRRASSIDDYRDDSSAINMVVSTRPNAFGDTGRRKVVGSVLVDYRVGATNTGTSLNYSLDLETEYSGTSAFTVPKPTSQQGLSDPVARDITTISHSVARRRGIYFSTQLVNGTIDENVEVAGITYRVAGLDDRGILQAKQTTE